MFTGRPHHSVVTMVTFASLVTTVPFVAMVTLISLVTTVTLTSLAFVHPLKKLHRHTSRKVGGGGGGGGGGGERQECGGSGGSGGEGVVMNILLRGPQVSIKQIQTARCTLLSPSLSLPPSPSLPLLLSLCIVQGHLRSMCRTVSPDLAPPSLRP